MKISIATIDLASGIASTKEFQVKEPCSVKEALEANGISYEKEAIGLWCKKVSPDCALSEGDRIDLGCALRVDRQKARKLRAESAQKAPSKTLARHGGTHQLQKS